MASSAPSCSGVTDADLRAQVRLAGVPGVGPRARLTLLAHFGSAEAALAASEDALVRVPGVSRKLAAAVASAADDRFAAGVLKLCGDRDVHIVPHGSPDYPGLLGQIDDPPGLLFVRGGFQPCDALAIAIVGSRHATAYGRKVAWQLAGGLARAGYTIVSGLARGIDAAAHRGALDAGGRTIAVLGSGVLAVYPPEHDDLAAEIAGRGAVISEVPPLAEPSRGAFPQRNRIVSGLSLGTIVVQGAATSGAMITARLAGEQGREVFAVPGPIDCRMSRGCHRLIRDGARLVESVDDVLEELGPLFSRATTPDGHEVRVPAELRLDDVERRVLEAVDERLADGTAADIDEVLAASGLAVSQVLATLGVLEMRRILRRLPGNRIERA
jgi:DNA processing protein